MRHAIATCFAGLLLLAPALSAGEKKLMHCFYFTPLAGATQADWDAFYKATDELPGKIPGLTHVWYGKLRNNIAVFQVDSATRKALASGETSATGKVERSVRQYGVCMEMDSLDTLKNYAASPAHKAWVNVYSKVRQEGTSTFDILGQ